MTNTKLVSLLVLAGTAILLTSTATSQSAASSVTVGSGENDSTSTAGSVTAQGGNVTSANITVESITDKWSAFYGQLTADERLSDSTGNNFYKWTVSNPTASGSYVYAVPQGNGAPTSLSGVTDGNENSILSYGNFGTGADNADDTFNRTGVSLDTTSTVAADTFVQGTGPSDTFTSGLAQDGSSNPVFLAEVQQDSTGFDGSGHDFQLLVGVGEDTSTKSFDFYAKIG